MQNFDLARRDLFLRHLGHGCAHHALVLQQVAERLV
jgi:hypothetical protein